MNTLSHMKRLTAALAAVLLLANMSVAAERVLSIGGSVTEIIYALGEEQRLIGRDSTSTYPPEAQNLPNVGYMRALSPEGVLSVAPDLIVAEAGSGPAEVVDVLKSSGVVYVEVPEKFNRAGIRAKIETVAHALEAGEAGTALAERVDAELAAAEAAAAQAAKASTPKRVMFILSMQGGRIMASGQNTAADGIIRMAGAENAVAGFDGYKPLTDEAVSVANPDVILMMDRGGDHATNNQDLWTNPAIATTAAAKTKSVARIDGLLLLGFGPRTSQAILTLNRALYGE